MTNIQLQLKTLDSNEYEQWLLEKYPELYPKDADGRTLPAICGVSCPPGWRDIVADLHDVLQGYKKNSYRLKRNPDKKLAFWVWDASRSLNSKLSKWFDPYAPLRPKGKAKETWLITAYIRDKAAKSWRGRFASWRNSLLYVRLYPSDMFIKEYPCPTLQVDQVKEKFGGLRFYVEGADDQVEGMIKYAEHQASRTCMMTGERGTLYRKHGWYMTLSPARAETLGDCVPVKPQVSQV